MSMSISAVNYLSNTHQSARTTGEEKREQKEAASDIGKAQESSVSASLDQVNMGQDGIAVTEVSRQQGAEQSTTQKGSAAPRTDTVEISAEGRAANAQAQERTSDTSAVEQYEAKDLSEYTNTELRQMYYKGEITRQEYEEETGETLD